jgi:hypothetical protein
MATPTILTRSRRCGSGRRIELGEVAGAPNYPDGGRSRGEAMTVR